MASLPTSYDGDVCIGVIGGTGLAAIPHYVPVASIPVTTPWGLPSSPITILEHHHRSKPTSTTRDHTVDGQSPRKPILIAFLSRHGIHHEFAAHEVNSRANIAALRKIGVRTILAFSAVGSLREEIRPRDFLVPDQIIDRTKGIRPFTFFEGGAVCHVPFAEPFDPVIAKVVAKCANEGLGAGGTSSSSSSSSSSPLPSTSSSSSAVPAAAAAASPASPALHGKGTLVCMEGPQFSTRAESNLYRSWGGSVINMSCLPEAKLAREAEMAYQMICMATDYDCWRSTGDSDGDADTVTVDVVMQHMKANSLNAMRLLAAVVDELAGATGAGPDAYKDRLQARHLQGQSKMGITTAPEGIGSEARERINWLFPGLFDGDS